MNNLKHGIRFAQNHFYKKVSIKNVDIFPCNNYFCKCIEYLDFTNKQQIEYFKQCQITHNNNSKYERNNFNKNLNFTNTKIYQKRWI